jgi:hypothetical protein
MSYVFSILKGLQVFSLWDNTLIKVYKANKNPDCVYVSMWVYIRALRQKKEPVQ